ncbi:MAG: class I SAM-dependent methyltransferase [Oscillospiraceae bacterium]|nr:class I SAM-dependent methyltransferase [Oscillospiraceae bacterium]
MEKITFSFGENWKNYSTTVDEKSIKMAQNDIKEKIEKATGNTEYNFTNKTVLDIGCGSGIHSLSFFLWGVQSIYSFDYDINSVEATIAMREHISTGGNWHIEQGNILDDAYVDSLPCSDIVYSWGCLHHTGNMWKALDNAQSRLNKNGLWFLSIYQGVETYKKDLFTKKTYNKLPLPGKKIMEAFQILKAMAACVIIGKESPFKWNKKDKRGMTVYYNIVDWLGGLPYEVASPAQIKEYGEKNGLELLLTDPKDACCIYIFRRKGV